MQLQWSDAALGDIGRRRDFLAIVNPRAAAKVVQSLTSAPEKLMQHPRLGQRLEGFEEREVRRIFVGDYEMRYTIVQDTVLITRLWHAREDR